MYYYLLLLIPYVPIVYSYSYNDLQNKVNYGPYVAEYKYFNLTYLKNTGISSLKAGITQEKGKYIIYLNVTIFTPIKVDEIKIYVYRVNNTKNMLWNYKVTHPCQHYALASIIREYNQMDKNCVQQTGTFPCRINITDLTRTFFGTSFFLGDFLFKVNVISKKKNVMIINTMASFKKYP